MEDSIVANIVNPYKSKPNYVYKFECGCLYTKEDLNIVGNKNAFLCPKHREKVAIRYIACARCGVLEQKGRSGFCDPVCSDCKENIPNVYLVNLKKIPTSMSCKTGQQQQEHKVSKNRYNCKNRNECLRYTCSIKVRADYLPCWRCKAYDPVPIELETFRAGTFDSPLSILYI